MKTAGMSIGDIQTHLEAGDWVAFYDQNVLKIEEVKYLNVPEVGNPYCRVYAHTQTASFPVNVIHEIRKP